MMIMYDVKSVNIIGLINYKIHFFVKVNYYKKYNNIKGEKVGIALCYTVVVGYVIAMNV